MKDNIDNELYEAFKEREYPSDKIKKNLHIRLNKIEDNKKTVVKIKSGYSRIVAITAAVVIIICIYIGNVGGVQAAIHKLFTFIPEVGIVEENNNEILYYMAGGPQSIENEYTEVKINNVYITEGEVYVSWQVHSKKSYTQYGNMKIVIGDKVYEQSWGDFGAGKEAFGTAGFSISDVSWSLKEIYQIEFQGSKIEFSLQNYETYKNVEDIGPTQLLNDISITAIPEWTEDSVIITIYNLNFSTFDLVEGYEDLLSESAPYLTIGDILIESEEISGYGNKVNFDLSEIGLTEEMKDAAVLHIPTIRVQSHDNKSIKVSLSKDTSKNIFPESVKFSDCTMYIIGLNEEVHKDIGKCLKFTFKFDYDREYLMLDYFKNPLINNEYVGGYSWDYDKETGYYYLYLASDIDNNKINTITFSELVYKINDEYQIVLAK